MDISGVGSNGLDGVRQNIPKRVGIGGSSVVDEFTTYMKKSPMERMMEDWLQAHGISKEEFDAMEPEEKQKILDTMKKDIEEKLKEKMKTESGVAVDFLA